MLVKLVVVENAYITFAFFKTFLALPSIDKFAKQAKVKFLSESFYSALPGCTLLMGPGLSKAINLFELCPWFIANFRENWWKLYKFLWMKIVWAPTTMWTRANWLIHSDSWFLIGWNAFPTCRVVSQLWLDEEISVWGFHTIESIRKTR